MPALLKKLKTFREEIETQQNEWMNEWMNGWTTKLMSKLVNEWKVEVTCGKCLKMLR